MSDKHHNAALRAAAAASIAELLKHIIGPIREVARNHGYAVAVHGSLARDIDLLAMPWTEHADDPDELVRSIRGAIAGVLGRCLVEGSKGELKSTEKPHGRRAYTLIHPGEGWIDLSVAPRLIPPEDPKC